MAKLGGGDWWQLPLAMVTGGLGAGPLVKQQQRKRVEEHGQKLDEGVRAHMDELRKEAELSDQRLYDNLIKAGIDQEEATRIVGQSGSAKSVEDSRLMAKSYGGREGAGIEGQRESIARKTKAEKETSADELSTTKSEAEKPGAGKAVLASQAAQTMQDMARLASEKNKETTALVGAEDLPSDLRNEYANMRENVAMTRKSRGDPNIQGRITANKQVAESNLAAAAPELADKKVTMDREAARIATDPRAIKQMEQDAWEGVPYQLQPGQAIVPKELGRKGGINLPYVPERVLSEGQVPGFYGQGGTNIFGAPTRLQQGSGIPGQPDPAQFKDFNSKGTVLTLEESARAAAEEEQKAKEEAQRLRNQSRQF